nr:fimbria/pilus outer membrane usher protein [Pantoea sp. 201603H]
MRMMKGLLFFTFFLNVNYSYSQDYFNPLFLGSDVDSIEDLSYIAAGNNVTPGKYFLSINVGDSFLGSMDVIFKEDKKKKVSACFTKKIIDIIPLKKDVSAKFNAVSDENTCVNISDYIDDFNYDVNLSKLTLTLQIPQIYLKSIRSTLANEADWDDGIPALVTNYNVNGSYTKNKKMEDYSSTFFSVSNRLNLGSWRFNSSTYYNQSKAGNKSSHEWNSNNFFATKNINSISSTLTIGQSVLGTTLFDSNTFIGVSLATSNEMLPESERGYSPVIKGVAETRSKITIKQNDNILYQEYINPGPYNIDNLNSVGSSGDYEVELTSDQGLVTRYIVPYSSLPNLLRHRRYNYSVSAGQLDISYAEKSKFLQGTFGYGLPLDTTVYTGYQIADDYAAFGLGLGKDMGNIGALSLDSIQAKATIKGKNYVGNSYRVLYAKSFSDTGTNIQLTGYRYSTSNYYSLSEANYQDSVKYDAGDYFFYSRSERKKNSFQINVSQSLGDYGQLYLWGNVNSYWGTDTKSQNTQIGWNKTFTQLNNVSLSANYTKTKYRSLSDNMFFLSFSMPLTNGIEKNRMYLSNSTSYNNSKYNNNTSLYGNALDNKLNYNIYQSVSNNNQDRSNLNANYKANAADISTGTSFTGNSKEFDYGVTGSMVIHQGGVVFAREANDTAILVEAKGAVGAQLDRVGENISIDRFGYALIPYATAYHYNDVALSPESFGTGYDVDGKILKVAPTRGAISKVVFDVRKGYNFLASVSYKGTPLKFGTIVTSDADSSTSIVNDDHTVYLTGVRAGTQYTVKVDNNNKCKFTISYDEKKDMERINNVSLTCQ